MTAETRGSHNLFVPVLEVLFGIFSGHPTDTKSKYF